MVDLATSVRARRRCFWHGFTHPFAGRLERERAVRRILREEGLLSDDGGERPEFPRWRFLMPGRFRAWCAYHHALDDVWDLALDDHNPCHDEVRRFIAGRRKEVPRV